jgi:predicted XRE-type DNA-binding protein
VALVLHVKAHTRRLRCASGFRSIARSKRKIICILKERELSMSSAAKVADVPRSYLSRIRKKHLERFRLDRLIVILGKLDEDVEVNVTFTSRKHSHHLA